MPQFIPDRTGRTGAQLVNLEREQLIKAEAKKQQQEQEQKKKQQVVAVQKAAVQKNDAQRKANTVNPVQPIKKFLESPDVVASAQNPLAPILQGFDVIAGTNFSKPTAPNKTLKGIVRPLKAAGKEINAAVVQGVADVAEGVTSKVSQLALDATVNKNKPPDAYLRAKADFGGDEPKTAVGKFSSKMLSFIIATRLAGKALGPLGKLGTSPIPAGLKGLAKKGAQAKRLLQEGLIPGAVADLILTDPEEGNLSNFVQDLAPEHLRDSWVFALATKPDDNPWVNILKTVVEGGPLNTAGNAVGALLFGQKAAKAVKAAGGSQEEQLVAGVKAAADKSEELLQTAAKDGEQERIRWTEANEIEMNQLLSRETKLNEDIAKADPEGDDIIRLDQELQDLQLQKQDLESNIYDAANPAIVREPQETQATIKAGDINDIAAEQINLEDGFRGTKDELGFNPGKVSVRGGSKSAFTDAQKKILNLTQDYRKTIDKFSKKLDLKDIAKKVGRTVDEVRTNAERIYDELSDSYKTFDELIEEQDLRNKLGTADGLLTEPKGQFATPEAAVAVKTIISDLTAKMYDLAFKAEDFDYSQIGGANNFDRIVDNYVALLSVYKESSNYYGAGLNSFKVRLKALYSSQEQISKDLEEDYVLSIKGVRKWANNIKSLARKGDPEAQDQMRAMVRAMVLAGGDPSKTINYWRTATELFTKTQTSIFYNSILSGFKTFVRNTGSIIKVVESPISMTLGGALKGDPALIKAGMAGFFAATNNLDEALHVFKTTWTTGIPQSWTPKQVVDKAEMEAMVEMMSTMAKPGIEQQAIGNIKGYMQLAKWLDYPGKLLMSTDDMVKTIIARQRIAEKSMLAAMRDVTNPLDFDQRLLAYTKKYSEYIDPATGRIKDKGLQEYANIGTFQDDPGVGINSLAMFLDNMPYLGPVGRMVVPFLRTPANIFRYQMEFTPLVGKYAGEYLAVKKSGDELRIAEYEGREMLGAMIISGGILGGMTGNLTGNTPVDPDERRRWQVAGIQSRSLYFNGIYISYNYFAPISNILAASADLAMLARLGGPQEVLENLQGQLTLALAASLVDQSYSRNLADMAEILSLKNSTPEKAQMFMLNFANNNLPLAGLRRGFANSFDPYMREYQNSYDKVAQSFLPGIRNMYPPRISEITGQPIRNPNGGLWNANLPFEISVDPKDKVGRFLLEAKFKWDNSLDKGKFGVELSVDDKYFIRMAMYNTGLRTKLLSLSNQKWVKDSMMAYRNREIGEDPETQPQFYKKISEIWNEARKDAFNQLENRAGSYGEQVMEARKDVRRVEQGNFSGKSLPQAAPQSSTTLKDLESLRSFSQ